MLKSKNGTHPGGFQNLRGVSIKKPLSGQRFFLYLTFDVSRPTNLYQHCHRVLQIFFERL